MKKERRLSPTELWGKFSAFPFHGERDVGDASYLGLQLAPLIEVYRLRRLKIRLTYFTLFLILRNLRERRRIFPRREEIAREGCITRFEKIFIQKNMSALNNTFIQLLFPDRTRIVLSSD